MVNDKLDQRDLEILKYEYEKLANDWRHINTIIWGLPTVAVVIFTGILVAAYNQDLAGWPRIVSLSIGSLFLFAVTIEVVKKRHDLNIIGFIMQKLQVDVVGIQDIVKIKLDKELQLPIGFKDDVKDFHKDYCDIKEFKRDYKDPVFKFFYRSYAKQYLSYMILTAAISMAILAELEFFWFLEKYLGKDLDYVIMIMIGLIAAIAPCIVFVFNLRREKKRDKGEQKTQI